MNTKNLKAYAPKARSQFIEAIIKRAAQFGIYQDKIVEVEFEGGAAIIEGRAFTKKQGEQRKALERKIEEKSLATHKERYDLFVREMAYTWFNRLAAIRYMELHDYLDHGFRVLSNPNSADSLPEILDHASDVVETLDPDQKYLDKNHIIELQLAGNKEEELYRELLLGQCHRLYNIMPFMFEAIDDATELLLPDNLTKTDSILKGLVNEIPEEDWREIEVIGWLYQFYISEHKDAVMGKVVKSEDIPAATQLFTPNWIVKYLVQNSLGRQWLATYPESELKGKMEYYIEPAEQSDDVIAQLKAITPTSIDPEQIKVLDPAAGSGHILVEVYELLREIYLERGYRLREIPELILTKNIYGLDIDDRAAQLAGFALMMKAREDDRRIFQRVEDGEVSLNVYSLQSTEGLDIGKLWQALNLEGTQKQGTTGGLFEGLSDGLDDESEGFVQPSGIYKEYFELLQTLKSAFLQAKTLGSLIKIDNCHLQNLVNLKGLLQVKEKGSDPSSKQASSDLLPIIKQTILLAQQYNVVVANPPYMGNKGMNTELKEFAKKVFPKSKSDLFSMMKERSFSFLLERGYNAMIVMESWMFLSSYQRFREDIVNNRTIIDLVHMPYNGRGRTPLGINFGTSASIIQKLHLKRYKGHFSSVSYNEIDDNGVPFEFPCQNEKLNKPFIDDFKKIPGSPIAYWVSKNVFDIFDSSNPLGSEGHACSGLQSGNNDLYLRQWFEVSSRDIGFNQTDIQSAEQTDYRWFPHKKGGAFRRWYGNCDYIIDWKDSGFSIKNNKSARPQNTDYWFKEGVTWSHTSSGLFSVRHSSAGVTFNVEGPTYFSKDTTYSLGYLCSSAALYFMNIMNPTMHFLVGNVAVLPFIEPSKDFADKVKENVEELLLLAKKDWDESEISWDFSTFKLCSSEDSCLRSVYNKTRTKDFENICKFKHLEEDNNLQFIKLYGLSDDVDSKLPIKRLTLNSNLNFKYSSEDNSEELEKRFTSDTMSDLLSYSLGCMMGRYSLDREGLIYAKNGNKDFKELVTDGTYNTFPADDDGIVPLASEDWLFEDDATGRFREFVKIVWGHEYLRENIEFVAESLCLHALKPVKGESANDTIRRYFSKQFYKSHCLTYSKRPIYWLFSSGKEKAFECLVYLHRYNEGTLSRMRTEYVTPLMGKYEAQHSLLTEQKLEATTTEARRIEKELKSLEKKQAELRTFDEQLKHYAEMRITLDLDDGVKANYGKFGNLLADVKAIHGKAVK